MLLLNGRPVKFHGISRLDEHPLLGRALTPEMDRLDMEMIKDANFNMVRATIAPPHPASLDYSDELGIYVENEGPTCWGAHADDLRYAAVYQGVMCEYLERDRNHPCVVDWSICNESDYGRVFSMTQRKMKSLDPTRIYSATFTDDPSLDVTTYHHPLTMKRIKDSLDDRKPVFFDEVITPFHGMYDEGLFLDLDPGMRDYWIEGLAENPAGDRRGREPSRLGPILLVGRRLLRARQGNRDHAAEHRRSSLHRIGLQAAATRRDRRAGLGNGGRLAAAAAGILVLEEALLARADRGEAAGDSREPASRSSFRCEAGISSPIWTNTSAAGNWADEKGEARAKAAPMSNGTLEIAVKQPPRARRQADARSSTTTAARCSTPIGFRSSRTRCPKFPNSGKPARIAEQSGYLDEHSAVRLLGPRVELAYDRTQRRTVPRADRPGNGDDARTEAALAEEQVGRRPSIRSARIARSAWSSAPRTCPAIRYGISTGRITRRKATRPFCTGRGTTARISTAASRSRMDDAGDIEYRYEFKYNGKDLWVREIGLDFELPLDFDRLRWDRNAEFSYYPADHIGRPLGEAVAHPAVPQTVPAGDRPFGLDDHQLGCNDFRSVKRHIYTASLTNKEGEGRRSDLRRHAARPRDRRHARNPLQGARFLRRLLLDLSRRLPLWPRPIGQERRSPEGNGQAEIARRQEQPSKNCHRPSRLRLRCRAKLPLAMNQQERPVAGSVVARIRAELAQNSVLF